MKMIYVEWWDPQGHDRDGWRMMETILREKGGVCRTLGFILKEDQKSITLSGTIAEDPEGVSVLGYLTIPKSIIRKLKRVKL